MAAEILASAPAPRADQDRAIAAVFERESRRLRGFIRRRVADAFEAEDIAQEVFFELIAATRVAKPIEHVGAWLFRVAANRITDRFRRASTLAFDAAPADAAGEARALDELLASPDVGPEDRYAQRALMLAIERALAELPAEQREVFIAHELEGQSFKSLADASGLSINTLLARKRYAVLHLRRRLRDLQPTEPSNQDTP
jgi:RNA polymerase sigma factor (sigma-70 family)